MTTPFSERPWFWCLFPTVVMSLGWMLRGHIGGGPLGAMIPGAMLGLCLCLLLSRQKDAGLIAAFAAIGIGFGGQETYGQTVGLSINPETFSWAIIGFFLKGGIWGFLGGAIIGIAFLRERYSNKDLIAGFLLMVAGTFAGWKLINEPKLIYFSDRFDRPRAELWAGLLIGALLLLVWLSWRGGARLPWSFALWGGLGGGIGFASGAAIQVWGRANVPVFPFGWWKVMEMTFGALLGLSFGYCAWRHRRELIPAQKGVSPAAPLPQALLWAIAAIAIGLLLYPKIPSRLEFTVAGTLLLTAALYSDIFCWQTAITLTSCAFAIDLLKARPTYSKPAMWTFVVLATTAVAVYTARRPRPQETLLLITWSAVGVSALKSFMPPSQIGPHVSMESVFVILAIVTTLCTLRRQTSPAGSPAARSFPEQVDVSPSGSTLKSSR